MNRYTSFIKSLAVRFSGRVVISTLFHPCVQPLYFAKARILPSLSSFQRSSDQRSTSLCSYSTIATPTIPSSLARIRGSVSISAPFSASSASFATSSFAKKVIPFLLTDIGEGITEVELLNWFVKVRAQQYHRCFKNSADGILISYGGSHFPFSIYVVSLCPSFTILGW